MDDNSWQANRHLVMQVVFGAIFMCLSGAVCCAAAAAGDGDTGGHGAGGIAACHEQV